MQSKLVYKNLKDLPLIAEKILNFGAEVKVFAFYGELGAGKTTIIKAICDYLHVTDQTSSPSFNILHEYKTQNDESVYHFDFYRIKKLEEVYDLGFENYIDGDQYCFIEWPEKMEGLLNVDHVKVNIEVENEQRTIFLEL